MIPTRDDILWALDRLKSRIADDLETQWLEFKPWSDPKTCMREAVEYTACFANADGGVIVFGVSDRVIGRAAIHGAAGYDLNVWRRGIFAAVRPNLIVEVDELDVPEGTGKLLVVRVPKGSSPPYGTADGLFKVRVDKNCMPLDPQEFQRIRIRSGSLDWSGEAAENVNTSDLDPVEAARARNMLARVRPGSELLKLPDREFHIGLGAIRDGRVTNAGLLLFGQEKAIAAVCPQHQVHYVHQASDVHVTRNDSFRFGLLQILERIEQAFTGPANPEQELSVGLHKLRIPAFPVDVVREAVLNAVVHRSYVDPGEVLVRHTKKELVVTSPGGFIAGITPLNILRHEPASRNRTLSEAMEKLGLVERAGIGRRRIFESLLSYGKREPKYEGGKSQVTLRIFDGSFDERMARLVATWKGQGRDIDLDGLLILSYLREYTFLDTSAAADLLQLDRESAKGVLDQLAMPKSGILERRGRTRAATYHLNKAVAKDLLGKAGYTRIKGLNPIRYAEMVKSFLADHGSITPAECRELLGLGESQSARVEVSRYLTRWTRPGGFLRRQGNPPRVRYFPASGNATGVS